MSGGYTKFYPGGWQDLPSIATPIDAAALNNFDAGIQNLAGVAPSGDTTGATDTPAIAAILAAGGNPVLVSGQTYYTDAPLVVPPLQAILCNGGSTLAYYGGSTAMPLGGAIIKPSATFAGATHDTQAVAGVIVLLSKVLGGYSAAGSGNQALRGITIDGRSAPAGTNGIEAWGPVWGVGIDNCGIYGMPNYGVMTSTSTPDGTGKAPDLWRARGLHVAACGSDGWNNNGGLADSYIGGGSQFTGNGGNGVTGGGFGNTQFDGVRFEFNTGRGVALNPSGTGNAGALGTILKGCSTDHNGLEGYYVFGANGRGPVCLDGCTSHGDGFITSSAGVRNNSTYGYLMCSNLRVLTVSGATPFPANGLRCDTAGAILSVDSGIIYGNSAAIFAGSGTVTTGATVLTGTGAWGG